MNTFQKISCSKSSQIVRLFVACGLICGTTKNLVSPHTQDLLKYFNWSYATNSALSLRSQESCCVSDSISMLRLHSMLHNYQVVRYNSREPDVSLRTHTSQPAAIALPWHSSPKHFISSRIDTLPYPPTDTTILAPVFSPPQIQKPPTTDLAFLGLSSTKNKTSRRLWIQLRSSDPTTRPQIGQDRNRQRIRYTPSLPFQTRAHRTLRPSRNFFPKPIRGYICIYTDAKIEEEGPSSEARPEFSSSAYKPLGVRAAFLG